MDRLTETAKRAVRAHFLTTGDTKKHGHPRDGLAGALVKHGFSDAEAAAVHTKAGEHLTGKHGLSHHEAMQHLNGDKGRDLAHRLDKSSPEAAVSGVRHHIDQQRAG